ncbi:MAG: SoxR reducing system RseC family protein [Nitrospirota bacterium]
MLKFETVEEIGVIENVEGTSATVKIQKKNACQGCSLNVCKPSGTFMEIEAFNRVNARVGQKVKISMASYSYVGSAIIVYGIPALALIGGAVIGREFFSRYFHEFDADLISAIFAFGAFITSFLFVKIWSVLRGRKTALSPVIEEILDD